MGRGTMFVRLRRVLVVDDDASLVEAVADGLPMVAPVEVTKATSGEAARKVLQSNADIEILLCDARMPGLSGLDLLAWAKSHNHKARRILITGYSQQIFPPQELERAQPLTVVSKPLNLSELARLMEAQ
jgi:two-component system, response regulator YesN